MPGHLGALLALCPEGCHVIEAVIRLRKYRVDGAVVVESEDARPAAGPDQAVVCRPWMQRQYALAGFVGLFGMGL